jgi:hypothetical protein
MENEASSIALVLGLDPEFVFEIASIPKQVNDRFRRLPDVQNGQPRSALPGTSRRGP